MAFVKKPKKKRGLIALKFTTVPVDIKMSHALITLGIWDGVICPSQWPTSTYATPHLTDGLFLLPEMSPSSGTVLRGKRWPRSCTSTYFSWTLTILLEGGWLHNWQITSVKHQILQVLKGPRSNVASQEPENSSPGQCFMM